MLIYTGMLGKAWGSRINPRMGSLARARAQAAGIATAMQASVVSVAIQMERPRLSMAWPSRRKTRSQ
jgi:hypothetical protein